MTRSAMIRRVAQTIGAAMWLMLAASTGYAQPSGQVWTNVTSDWLSTERLTYELDLEPKSQVVSAPGQPLWMNLDVTPSVAYAATGWLDLIGELTTGYTDQTDNHNTFEATVRAGLQFHILSRVIQPHLAGGRGADREKLPLRRAVVSTLLRVEQRNFVYGGTTPTESSWRFRDRVEFDYPLNRPKLTMDGAVYLSNDGEAFVPLASAADAGRVSQFRIRTGIGYRQSFAWRFEALYIWTGTRNADGSGFTVASHALDVRIKRMF